MAVFPIQPVPLIIPSASNCLLWMRPQDTRAENMTFSGGRLAAIKNLANNRILINNTVTANQPSTGVETINGLNAIGFDNDNNRWLLTGLPASITNFTFFTVVQQVISASQGIVLGGSASVQVARMSNTNLGYSSTDGTTGVTLAAGTSVFTAPAIFAITGNVATSTRNLYKNSPTIGATGAYDGTVAPGGFGTAQATSGSARGGFKMGETIVYKSVLSADEITTIMRYLANQLGVILT
jgi:hypothetical protein